MSRMLLSIKPKYANKIISGEKKYEFRKFHCRTNVDTIVIYASSPIKQIIGEVSIIEIIEGEKDEVWNRTKQNSGITKKDYKDYYKNKNSAVAYKLGQVTVYEEPIDISEVGLTYVPQSFAYI